MYQVHVHHNLYTWLCFQCGLPSFTNSSMPTTLYVSNSVQSLPDLPSESSIIPSVPVSSRGPLFSSSQENVGTLWIRQDYANNGAAVIH